MHNLSQPQIQIATKIEFCQSMKIYKFTVFKYPEMHVSHEGALLFLLLKFNQ